MKNIARGAFSAALILAFPTVGWAADGPVVAHGPTPAWAKLSEPLPTPEDSGGLAFVNAQDTLVHLDDDGQTQLVSQRLTLLNPQALQIGNVGLTWNPAAGAPTVHALAIHRGDETIDILGKTDFEVLRREDQLETAVLDGLLTAVLRVPDLRVGDQLEFTYSVPSQDPTLKADSAGLLALAGTTLPGRYHLGLSWEPGQKPQFRSTGDFSGETTQAANAVDIRTDNPPAIIAPKNAPPRYAWQRVLEYTDFSSFAQVSKRFAPLYAGAAALPANSPVRQEAARIAAAHQDPLDRAQAALELVQQQVRYIYVGLDGGNLMPAKADDTWQRRYGDCKGKTVLLLALLNELGIQAEPVLVRNDGSDDGFDARLPAPSLFDHVMVRAAIAGKHYWLDGTLPAVATASEQPDFPYRWVLPLTAKGSALEQITWAPAKEPDELNLYDLDVSAGLDEPARIATTSIKRGPKALIEYLQFSAITNDQLLQAFRGNLTGSSQWNTVDSVKYHYDVAARASVLEIIGSGPVDWEKGESASRWLALPGGGFSPPERRQRAADQDQSAPFYSEPSFDCYVTTVHLPKDTDPSNWDYNTTFDTAMFGRVYYRMMERRDDSFRMVRGSRVDRLETSQAQAAADNKRIARFDNSRAILTYSPGEQAAEPVGMTPVPAASEGDWLHSAQYCLPPDLRR